MAGGGSGAVIGAAMGWLVGAGAMMIPGLETLTAAGPVMAMLGGMGVGVTLGGLTGAAVGAGIPEYEAKRYEGPMRKGGILLSVHCDDEQWTKIARRVLEETDARDVSVTGEARGDYARTEKPLPRARFSTR